MRTAAVVLAAGRGSRLGTPSAKPLLDYRGRPLVAWALAAAREGGCDPVLLVVGHDGDRVAAAVPPDVRVVRAEAWADGISASLAAGLDALEPERDVGAVCIGLADQPGIGPEAYRRLAAAGARGAELAVATYAGARRNPVLLARAVWPDARALTGDEGARQLLRRRSVVEVDCTGTGDPGDVDTLDDLRALERRHSGTRPTPSPGPDGGNP